LDEVATTAVLGAHPLSLRRSSSPSSCSQRLDADGKGMVSTPADSSRNLRAFREKFYRCASLRADALFELTDAILTSGTVSSPPHLSLAPVHRRGWCSLYAALSQGHIDAESVRDLLAEQPFDDGLAEERPAVYAVDVSSWPRCDAESSPERGYYYHPSRHSAGQPIVAGWAYQLVAGLGFVRDSWVAPMDARRVKPDKDANEVAVRQVRALVTRLPQRGAAAPLFVFDAGYDPVRLQRSLGGCHAQILVRLQSSRVF
jgi:hypothetical protein